MTYVTQKEQMRYIGSYSVDYIEGGVLMLESVKDISPFFPLEPTTLLFVLCNKGQQLLDVDGTENTLSENHMIIFPSKMRIICKEHSEDFDCKVLRISESIVRGLLRDKVDLWQHESKIRHLDYIPLTQQSHDELSLYLTIIRSKLKNNNSSAPHDILLALLRAFMLELYFVIQTGDCVRHEHLSQGKLLFNRFLALISGSEVKRQPISVYASQLAITPNYLTMLCLKFSDKTASEWVAQYTVDEIRLYLKSSELSIKEISARLGFSNMSHFGSYVRKHLGMSPSEYRYNKRH